MPERKPVVSEGRKTNEDGAAGGGGGGRGGKGGAHVCAQFNKCSLPSVPFLGSTWLRRRGTVTLLPPRFSSLASLPPFVPAPRVSLIRMQSRRTSRASGRARCSSRFRLRAVQIYDSRDFYLIPIPHPSLPRASRYSFLSERISGDT